jgi:hypothetical protein
MPIINSRVRKGSCRPYGVHIPSVECDKPSGDEPRAELVHPDELYT